MNQLLEQLFANKSFRTTDGASVPIHSETSREQCLFLQQLIRENRFSHSLEIGFAYGISALAITEAVANQNGHHVVIDKFEYEHWKGVGLDLIRQAGYENRLSFYEQYCYVVLPQLLAEGKKFDFAYIDSTKQFDWLMVDFFFIDKLLELNGLIVFDDVVFPGIRKLLRYLVQFPSYRVYRVFPLNRPSSYSRKAWSLLSHVPGSRKVLQSNLMIPDYQLGINASCVALQKVSEDNRNWDWHHDF